jgi:hypothetical protein
MPNGILSMTPLSVGPHDRGFKQNPYGPESSRRPRDEPAPTTVRHDAAPHPRTADAIKKERNTYGGVPYERR